MKSFAQKFHENIRTTGAIVPHIKPRSFLSKVFKVAEQNSKFLQFDTQHYLIHGLTTTINHLCSFLLHFHFSLDFCSKTITCSPKAPPPFHGTFPPPNATRTVSVSRRREAGMWVATLRTFAAMFRPHVGGFPVDSVKVEGTDDLPTATRHAGMPPFRILWIQIGYFQRLLFRRRRASKKTGEAAMKWLLPKQGWIKSWWKIHSPHLLRIHHNYAIPKPELDMK